MRGLLLVNIGTPETATLPDVKKFIATILSDPLLTDLPEGLSKFLARKIVAPLGSPSSTKRYQKIWRTEAPRISPLLYQMRKLATTIEEKKGLPVAFAMRYGLPDVAAAFRELERKCPLLHEVIVFPLFPHYAQSTTQTILGEVGRVFYRSPHSFRIKFATPYYDHPAYIHALSEQIKPYLVDFDRLLFCYHSLPIHHVETAWKKGKEYDYVYQLKETNRLVCESLGLDTHETLIFYSSQRGKNWLKPFLNTDIIDLPGLGWKKVVVATPGFSVDNLESLFDVNMEARQLFMEAGGEKFVYVPALNDSDAWVEAIWKIVERM